MQAAAERLTHASQPEQLLIVSAQPGRILELITVIEPQ
jgi:hypothetical protein